MKNGAEMKFVNIAAEGLRREGTVLARRRAIRIVVRSGTTRTHLESA